MDSAQRGKTIIVYNPRAGKLGAKGQVALTRAADELQKRGHDTALVPTTGPGTAGEIARTAIAAGARLILAAGGDGTVNETLEGVVGSAVPLGLLPAGTANVLANEMGVPSGIAAAAEQLAHSIPCRIPVGRVRYADSTTRHFLLMAGAGLDARIVYQVSGPLKAKVGKLAYWVAGFGLATSRLAEFRVHVEGRPYTCSFALVSKVRNYGGDFQIARDTSLFDDRFEVVLFAGRNPVRYLAYLAGVALNRVSGMHGVTVLRAREVSLDAAQDHRVYLQVDGEFAGRLPVSIEVVPDAVTLLVTPGYATRFRKPA